VDVFANDPPPRQMEKLLREADERSPPTCR
jgi:hypothetical protein